MTNNYQKFIGSFAFDSRLAPYDILGSVAHVKMLAKCKILTTQEASKITKGLFAIGNDISCGWQLPEEEDIHYAIEKELIKRIGSLGGKMHTARSRNDQVALDLRLYARDEAREIIDTINEFQRVISNVANKNISVVMPGYTHLQPAQPILFSHHILAYAWMLQRDKERLVDCIKRINVLPLGSAALAGTSFSIDRNYTAKLLSFNFVSENSMDAVSDRDFAVELVFTLSVIAMHLSKLAEELVLWSSVEFSFVRIADNFTSGSSIMPQKRNPDVAEIIRGKSGRVYGSLVALLTLLKGLPLAYNRDLQEDKPPLFDAVDTVKPCLKLVTEMLSTMQINSAKMLKSTDNGYLQATELADYLAKKDMPFRQAHGIVSEIVNYCISKTIVLSELSIAQLKSFSPLFENDVLTVLNPIEIIKRKISNGGTSKKSVKIQLVKLNKLCK